MGLSRLSKNKDLYLEFDEHENTYENKRPSWAGNPSGSPSC